MPSVFGLNVAKGNDVYNLFQSVEIHVTHLYAVMGIKKFAASLAGLRPTDEALGAGTDHFVYINTMQKTPIYPCPTRFKLEWGKCWSTCHALIT